MSSTLHYVPTCHYDVLPNIAKKLPPNVNGVACSVDRLNDLSKNEGTRQTDSTKT